MQLIEKEILIQVPTCPLFEITPQLYLIVNRLCIENIRIVALKWTSWEVLHRKLVLQAVSHKCPTAALLRYSGSVTYFMYAPSPSISVPCIWTLLRHLTSFLLNVTFAFEKTSLPNIIINHPIISSLLKTQSSLC